MTKSTRRRSPPKPTAQSAAAKLGELGVAVPQVVTHRMTRMALAGPSLSVRDQQEFVGMVVEKPVAFTQAWVAMIGEAVQLQGQLTAGLLGSLITHPLAGQGEHLAQFMTHLVEGPMRVVDKGLHPIHSKAVDNARRLGQARRKRR